MGSSEGFGFPPRWEPWSPDLVQTLTGCLRPKAESGLWAGRGHRSREARGEVTAADQRAGDRSPGQ